MLFTLYLGYVGILYITDIVISDNKHKLQDDIVSLLVFTSFYGFFINFDNRLSGKAKKLPLVISAVSVVALFIFTYVMGVRHSI